MSKTAAELYSDLRYQLAPVSCSTMHTCPSCLKEYARSGRSGICKLCLTRQLAEHWGDFAYHLFARLDASRKFIIEAEVRLENRTEEGR